MNIISSSYSQAHISGIPICTNPVLKPALLRGIIVNSREGLERKQIPKAKKKRISLSFGSKAQRGGMFQTFLSYRWTMLDTTRKQDTKRANMTFKT